MDSGPSPSDQISASAIAPSGAQRAGVSPTALVPAQAAVIELRDVYKSFGSLEVLLGVSLAMAEGQTTVVIGRSGTGKSVLLKHIVGLLRPDRGQVLFRGQRVDQLTEKEWVPVRRRFGVLFQLGALFDSLTSGENVAFPLVEHGKYSRKEIRDIVAEKFRIVGLDDEVRDKKPAEISGGQRKRVALARAIALNPEVILYDEPTTGLDPPRGDVINELIIKLNKELRVTSVVVTHDMTSAFKVADRMVMLEDGRFIADGSADEIRANPDERVRRFIEGRADEKELAALKGA
jgi:phospholipid/cholesterol/gamma-HCH transport system ATP-binding protein